MKELHQLIKGCVGIIFLLGASSVSSTIITFQEGFDGYNGTLTAEISSGQPNSTSNDSPRVSVDASNSSRKVTQTLVMFDDIFGVNGIPSSDVIIHRAFLRFWTKSFSPGPVKIFQMTIGWNSSVTWNSLGRDGLSGDISATADNIINSLPDESLVTFDVTASVVAWASGATNYGWGFTNVNNDGWDFNTEFYNGNDDWNVRRPLLTINYSRVSEPNSMALLGLGLLAVGFIRWKKRGQVSY